MHYQQWILLALITVCGAAVIGSYVHGLSTHPGTAEKLWGNVQGALRITNYITMLLAVAGFLVFTYFIFFRINPEDARIAGMFNYTIFFLIYALILIPSAFWMPLTYAMLANPNPALWVAVRGVLFLAGIGSLCMLGSLLTIQPHIPDFAYWMAVGGAGAFCVQTAVMDAFIWPACFST
jgi:hypothetical protein